MKLCAVGSAWASAGSGHQWASAGGCGGRRRQGVKVRNRELCVGHTPRTEPTNLPHPAASPHSPAQPHLLRGCSTSSARHRSILQHLRCPNMCPRLRARALCLARSSPRFHRRWRCPHLDPLLLVACHLQPPSMVPPEFSKGFPAVCFAGASSRAGRPHRRRIIWNTASTANYVSSNSDGRPAKGGVQSAIVQRRSWGRGRVWFVSRWRPGSGLGTRAMRLFYYARRVERRARCRAE